LSTVLVKKIGAKKQLKVHLKFLFILLIPLSFFGQIPQEIQILDKLTVASLEESINFLKEASYRHFEEDSVHLFKHKKVKIVYEERDNTASYLNNYSETEFSLLKNWFDLNYRLDETLNDEEGLQLTYFGNNKFWSLFHFEDTSGDWLMIVCITKME